ncbi:MAG: ABC transporter ATP-binding protein [Oscillospiraceae bacterium]|nr:ABC transporter ATP-binding protein [Oscillospiraceae bacterium]
MSIELKGVNKSYGETRALRDVTLTFGDNKIIGLLGRNGAGKTTMLKVISGLIFTDGGEVTVDGERAVENDKALGKMYLMSEETYYPGGMKIRDVFKWSKRFYPDFDEGYAARLAAEFGLNQKKNVRSLSTGYLSIFKLIVALSVNTPYLFLDEPVLGLDANHRELFYRLLLEKYAEKPSTIVISTHLIEEIAALIEHVVIIKNGEILRDEPREDLLREGYTVAGAAALVDAYSENRRKIGEDSLGGLKTVYLLGPPDDVPAGLEVSGLDLQKLFIRLTNS